MAYKIPVRFNRLAAAFDEGAKIRLCNSSGSEHSADADLSDLVISFHEREYRDQRKCEVEAFELDGKESTDEEGAELDVGEPLRKLFDIGDDVVRLRIRSEVEKVLEEVGRSSSALPEFKRRVMARLRHRGFDAGLCKSKWEKKGRTLSGEYEYIDINSKGTRYIVEISLAGEFTIARPTSYYTSLLELFPVVLVSKPDEMKQVVRIMCNAIRKSMKSVDIHVPPWRRLTYSQSKWFGTYKRTTNEASGRMVMRNDGDVAGNRLNGFIPWVQGISFNCREGFGARSRSHVGIGNLALALNQG